MTGTMDDESDLTREEWLAARMWMAILGSQAHEGDRGEFNFEPLGIDVMPIEDLVYALDGDARIEVGDMMLAANAVIWGLLASLAHHSNNSPENIISHLGLQLAAMEPEDA